MNITAFEFFAANAPDEIPAWFEHTGPDWPRPKKPDFPEKASKEDKEDIISWLEQQTDLPDHLQWYRDEYNAAEESMNRWRIENAQRRFFQWRKFYAIRMLNILKYEE